MPTILAIALLVFMATGLSFVAYVLWPRWPAPTAEPRAPSIPIMVGNAAFNVPPRAFRVASQQHSGQQDRVDLAFRWSPPHPAARPEQPGRSTKRVAAHDGHFYLTIMRSDGTLPAPQRLKQIYPRFTDGAPKVQPNGLAAVSFRDDTPYQGEDLFLDAAVPERFVVRCTRSRAADVRGACLHERRRGDADLVIRFPRSWLEDWHTTAAAIDRLIDSLARTAN